MTVKVATYKIGCLKIRSLDSVLSPATECSEVNNNARYYVVSCSIVVHIVQVISNITYVATP